MHPDLARALAKAAEESAKTAGKALDIVHDIGGSSVAYSRGYLPTSTGPVGELDPTEMVRRHGARTAVLDWRDRLVCSGCWSREVDMVLTRTTRRS
jgi:hypothetical protein